MVATRHSTLSQLDAATAAAAREHTLELDAAAPASPWSPAASRGRFPPPSPLSPRFLAIAGRFPEQERTFPERGTWHRTTFPVTMLLPAITPLLFTAASPAYEAKQLLPRKSRRKRRGEHGRAHLGFVALSGCQQPQPLLESVMHFCQQRGAPMKGGTPPAPFWPMPRRHWDSPLTTPSSAPIRGEALL
jgi:hypothetical protein